MQYTILGAGGSIGNALAYELTKRHIKVRLVSRKGVTMDNATTVKADLTNREETNMAIKGSTIVFLCVGLPYNAKIWNELWPKIIQNTIDGCKANNSKLIFFDNVYMYGQVSGKMTEETPYNPCSKKGEVRARIARMLDEEYKKGELDVISARAADLYGPFITTASIPYVMAFEKMIQGKSASWLLDNKLEHSYTYTNDCAKALLLLAADDRAFNQTWHLPTHNPPITGKEFIDIIANELHTSGKHKILSKWMIRFAGMFNGTIKEILEMSYQYDSPYYFDSSKFNLHYNFTPTKYSDGIRKTLSFYLKD